MADVTRRIQRSAAAATVTLIAVGCAAVGTAGTASAAAPKPCEAKGLTGKVTGTAAGMSQPASFITVTNTSGTTCTLKGYPWIALVGTKYGSVSGATNYGGVTNAPQVAVKKITLKPGGKAWFAMETSTAYNPPIENLTSIAFTTIRGISPSKARVVKISQQATSDDGGTSIPVNVTPWAKGTYSGE